MRRSLHTGLILIAAALLAGCGGDGLVPTKGIVTLDGKPLTAKASISFVPEGDGQAAFAVTDGEGKFELETHEERGAQRGNYLVVVTILDLSRTRNPSERPPAPSIVLPAIYGSKTTTPLKVALPHDGPVQIELKSS